jgi:hypothetical protein
MAEAMAKLAAAAVAVADDDETHEFFSDAEWEQERTDLDAAMTEVASYDRALIALFMEWALLTAAAAPTAG